MKYIYLFFPLYLFVIAPLELHATYILKNGKILKKEEMAAFSVQEHYSFMMAAAEKKNWNEVATQSKVIISNFPTTPFADESLFYLGAAYFHLVELEDANEQLTEYLKKLSAAKHFEEAITYKFKIAEEFRNGAKRRVLGLKKMPKLISGREKAIKIYEEVITALPNHELAAQSLFGKGDLLLKNEDFRASVETYQTLIRRFPKHYLAPESYLGIGKVYLEQCQKEFPDPDFLELAEINFRKFKQDFPGESRHQVAQSQLNDMKEVYAKTLFDIAEFYERTKKTNAARIYFAQILQKYGETKVAQESQKRYDKLSAVLLAAEQAKAKTEEKPIIAETVVTHEADLQQQKEEGIDLINPSTNSASETSKTIAQENETIAEEK